MDSSQCSIGLSKKICRTRSTPLKCLMSQSGWSMLAALPQEQRLDSAWFSNSLRNAIRSFNRMASRLLLALQVSNGLASQDTGARETGGVTPISISELCTTMTGWLKAATHLIHSPPSLPTGASLALRRSSLVRHQAFQAPKLSHMAISPWSSNLPWHTPMAGSVSCHGPTWHTTAMVTSTRSRKVSLAVPTGASALYQNKLSMIKLRKSMLS